jgi:hypothetical protein
MLDRSRHRQPERRSHTALEPTNTIGKRTMSRRRIFVELKWTLFAFALLSLGSRLGELWAQSPTISAPVLKWQYGGCLSGPYCQTGCYSSPAVADLDATASRT